MTHVIQPLHLLAIALAGWLNRHQQAVIEYLIPGEAGQALMDRDTKYTEEFRDDLDREGREASSLSGSGAELQCIRRTVCAFYKRGMLESHDSFR